MPIRTALFKSNRSQAVRVPKELAFSDDVKQVAIWREGTKLVIAPLDSMWDDFFDAPGIEFPDRDQPMPQERDWL
ncbi:MAG TPA: type II toxin-antitoxin system VapB family antitoxin [Sphingomonas sp.]|uniref:type II toxin-antitoxin system VapB family antitoxin n=1 Tax=Sphingomonas sp. TaxID=28214 RepID=UPI002EDA765E